MRTVKQRKVRSREIEDLDLEIKSLRTLYGYLEFPDTYTKKDIIQRVEWALNHISVSLLALREVREKRLQTKG